MKDKENKKENEENEDKKVFKANLAGVTMRSIFDVMSVCVVGWLGRRSCVSS